MTTFLRIIKQRLSSLQISASSRRSFASVREAAPTVTKQPSRKTFLIDRVAKAGLKVNISKILDEWVGQGGQFTRGDAVALLKHFRNYKNYRSALQLYDWIESSKLGMSNGDHALRIDILCKVKGIASAERYFNGLHELEKTVKTYGSLLSCYCKEKDLDKALGIFEAMKKLNYTTTLNYNNVMSLFYVVRQPEKAISLVREMEEYNVSPDGYTYNLMINCYASLEDFDAVDGVLEKMKSKRVGHDMFTYGNLATVYYNCGMHEKARAFLEKMERTECQNNRELYESCRTRFMLYSELDNIAGVLRTWVTLKSGFPKPNNSGYLMMLLALSKLGDRENLEKFYKEWEESCSIFDFRLPNVLLEYYISRDRTEEATSLYESLVKTNDTPNLRSLNSFAAICVRNNQIDSALKYLETGLDKGTRGDYSWFPTVETIKLFVDYFEKNDDPERADNFINCVKRMSHIDSDHLLSKINVTNYRS